MNFNPLPEEQKDPELVNSLQAIYARKPQDRESLARIEARFSQLSQMQTQVPPASLHDELPQRLGDYPRSKKGWTLLSTIAVLFAVALVTGAILLPFFFMKSQPTGIKQPTPTSQPTPFPLLSRTLLGQGAFLDGFSRRGFHMVSENAGWATEPGSLFRTTDGGKTWKQITLPQELQNSAKPFWVRVFDSDMVFVQPFVEAGAGSALLYFYRTVDAGVTWQRFDWPTIPEVAQDGIGVFAATFLDHERGWALVNRVSWFGTPQTLFQTNDGGKTWQKVALLPFKYLGYDLIFGDTQTGWILTSVDDPDAKGTDPNTIATRGVLSVTHDGGKTWKQQSLPGRLQPPTKLSSLGNLVFMNESEGYLFAGFAEENNNTGFLDHYLYRTHDGGKTWQIEDALLSQDYPDYEIVDATHLLMQREVQAPGENYALLTLTNGQWVKTSGGIAGAGITHVQFLNIQTALALDISGSNPDIYSSNDGGKTWKKISTLPVIT